MEMKMALSARGYPWNLTQFYLSAELNGNNELDRRKGSTEWDEMETDRSCRECFGNFLSNMALMASNLVTNALR